MRLGVEIECLRVAKTGVRAYVEGLYGALRNSESEIVALESGRPLERKNTAQKALNQMSNLYWTHVDLPVQATRARCDALLCMEYTAPLLPPCPTAVMFYDTSFWRNPQWYNRWWRLSLNLLAVPAARRAHRVIVISEFSRQEVARILHIPHEQIVVAYPAPRERRDPPADTTAAILAAWDLRPKGYALFIGVFERRKNLPLLVRAFAAIASQLPSDFKLVLAGQPGPRPDMDDYDTVVATIARFGLERRVVLTGYVSDEQAAALYNGAIAFAFPSLREGFGIPIVEAFQRDVPVVSSNAAALPETAGDAALLVDPRSETDLADALYRVISNAGLRETLILRGRERLKLFTWERAARQVLDVFERNP